MSSFSILLNDVHNLIYCKKHNSFDAIEPKIHHQWNSGTHKFEPHDSNADKKTELELILGRAEEASREIISGLGEMRLSTRYSEMSGTITAEEYGKLEDLFLQSETVTNRIARKYFTFRGWKSMDPEEFDDLIESMKPDADTLRELIRDRYVFEREVERRLGIIHEH